MRALDFVCAVAVAGLTGITHAQLPLGDSMTYQGHLTDGGTTASGLYDLTFRLYDAANAGTLVAGPVSKNDVNVTDGTFTVEIDFGMDAFDNEARWLEIDVEGHTLSPRQAITRTPYASQTRGINVDANHRVGIGTQANANARLRVWTDNPNLAMDVYSQQGDGLDALVDAELAYALRGQTSASDGMGIVGRHMLSGNEGQIGTPVHGLRGTSTVNNGAGIYGSSTGVPGYGGLFEYDGISGAAVRGEAESPTGFTTGVYGTSVSDNGTGVAGVMQAGSSGVGVLGWSGGPSGRAGRFLGRVTITGHTTIGSEGAQITSAELFGVHTSASTGEFGGMYVSGVGSESYPFYGYSAGRDVDAYHYFHGTFDQWRLWAGTTRIVVNRPNGRVGIGTTSPSFLLHVNGSAGKPGGGSWSVASDERLKTDIEPLDGALDSLLKLKGVNFKYKDPEAINELQGERIGLLAQDVERVFPDWIDEDEDGFKHMTVRGFEALTIEAFRDMNEQRNADFETLRNENAELRERLNRMEAMLGALIRQQGDR